MRADEGFGIFVNFGHYRMHVGTILPLSDGTFMLRVALLDQEHAPGFRLGELDKLCQSAEVAASEARAFLEASYVATP